MIFLKYKYWTFIKVCRAKIWSWNINSFYFCNFKVWILRFADFINYWEIQLNSRRERCKMIFWTNIHFVFDVIYVIACDLKISIYNENLPHKTRFTNYKLLHDKASQKIISVQEVLLHLSLLEFIYIFQFSKV